MNLYLRRSAPHVGEAALGGDVHAFSQPWPVLQEKGAYFFRAAAGQRFQVRLRYGFERLQLLLHDVRLLIAFGFTPGGGGLVNVQQEAFVLAG